MPSSIQCNCSVVSVTTASWRRGHRNLSSVSRFRTSTKPDRSKNSNFIRSQRRLQNAKTAGANGSSAIVSWTRTARLLLPARKSIGSRGGQNCRSTPSLTSAQGADDRRQCIHIAAFQRDLHAVRQRRAHFGRRTKSCSPLGFRPAHFIASRRQTHHRHAAPPRQGAIGSPLKLNRDERRWGR